MAQARSPRDKHACAAVYCSGASSPAPEGRSSGVVAARSGDEVAPRGRSRGVVSSVGAVSAALGGGASTAGSSSDAAGTTAAVTPPTPPKPKNIELVIEAFETVEIEMTQSTGKVERIKMSPSQIQTFKTVSGVKLNISNGGAVNLIVNGKDLGVPGDLGKPKRVSF